MPSGHSGADLAMVSRLVWRGFTGPGYATTPVPHMGSVPGGAVMGVGLFQRADLVISQM